MRRRNDKAGEIVSRYGGRIDKLMGDAVLAVFGDPVAHEDDAVRAVRTALELHSAINELRPSPLRRASATRRSSRAIVWGRAKRHTSP